MAEAALAATLIGAAARRALAEGMRGTVIAAFRRSFYIDGGAGRLACLGPLGMGAGPLNILVADMPQESPTVRARVSVVGDRLSVEGWRTADLAGARGWRPAAATWTDASLGQAALLLNIAIAGRLPSEGLAPLIFAGRADDAVARKAQPAMAGLRAWLQRWLDDGQSVPSSSGSDAVSPDVAGLLGLGPGLTPSGDDVLGGLLVTLRSLGKTATADELAAFVDQHAATRTNAISLAHLAAAASGQGSAALHDALAAAAAGDKRRLAEAVTALAAIGHVSGWDALAGAALALMRS